MTTEPAPLPGVAPVHQAIGELEACLLAFDCPPPVRERMEALVGSFMQMARGAVLASALQEQRLQLLEQ